MSGLREEPEGPALLDAARRTLLDDVLPHLPSAHRLPALMVASAMAIAAREARADPLADAALEARARDLLAVGAEERTGAAPRPEPADPWRALCRAIRGGHLDPGTPSGDDARTLLEDLAEARCAVSSPKRLPGQGS